MSELAEKTDRYERMLAAAILEAHPRGSLSDELHRGAEECLTMAEAYHSDGRHFLEAGDRVNALAAFSYGHGWLDAGVRIGVLTVPEGSELFTI